jgi:hypothetical protein
MRIRVSNGGCSLIREQGDKAISKESTVGYYMKTLLNKAGGNFVRMNPSKHGLTSCQVGMIDRKAKVIYWHERYQIENAAKAFNHGKVFFLRCEAN